MFSLSSRICVGLRESQCQLTFHLSKKYFNVDQKMKDLFPDMQPEDIQKFMDKKETEEEDWHPDPLEFRNVGPYKKSIVPIKNRLRFLSKDSIFRNVKTDSLWGTFHNIWINGLRKDQTYDPNRVQNLGADLAAAHFFTCRGGAVKFVGQKGFIKSRVNNTNDVLPNTKDPNYKIEALDLSGVHLIIEGLSHLADLKYLSWISFKNCPNFNNWYLDHLSAIAPTIEYLDISGCKNIDHHGLNCLYRFKNIKCINVEKTNDSSIFKLACLTCESELPNLIFIGLNLKPQRKSVFND